MKKISKHTQKRNLHTIYIRDNYKILWNQFIDLIEKDEDFKEQRNKEKDGIISISIMNLIYDYVKNKDPNFNLDNLFKNKIVDVNNTDI
jgi:hypothetical protein